MSVAEETDLKLVLSETPKTGFLTTRPNYDMALHDWSELLVCRFSPNFTGVSVPGVVVPISACVASMI